MKYKCIKSYEYHGVLIKFDEGYDIVKIDQKHRIYTKEYKGYISIDDYMVNKYFINMRTEIINKILE